jgi:hypothetical protein
MSHIVSLMACIALMAFAVDVGASDQTLDTAAKVQRSFFGMHIHKSDVPHRSGLHSRWPSFRFGTWRLWGAYVTWMDLEPTKGAWQFQRLDRAVALAEQNESISCTHLALRRAGHRQGQMSSVPGVTIHLAVQQSHVIRWTGRIM